jgi:hypothetical protein
MRRRALLTCGVGLATSILTGFRPAAVSSGQAELPGDILLVDLEPDGLAQTYRRYRLLIVGQRDDTTSNAHTKAVVDVLSRYLPESRCKLVRAADTRRVGVLIGTHQQDIAMMTREGADALFLAKAPFADIRDVPLRTIVSFENHVLVCREDFVARHAYLLAQTLTEHKENLGPMSPRAGVVIPVHQGAQAYFSGQPLPASDHR